MLAQHVRAAVRTFDRDSLQGRRDAALLLLGFAGGFRRAEIAALDVTDLEWLDDGAIVTIRQSKTDQAGAGRKVAIPRGRGASCPVSALRGWLDAAGIEGGPVFRSMRKGDRVTERPLSPKGGRWWSNVQLNPSGWIRPTSVATHFGAVWLRQPCERPQ